MHGEECAIHLHEARLSVQPCLEFIKYQRFGYWGLFMIAITLGVFSVHVQSSCFNRREASKTFNFKYASLRDG